MRALRFTTLRCTRRRHRRSTCTLCADHCPTAAIAWAAPLNVAADRCTGCGVCASVCPTGAFEPEGGAEAWPPANLPAGALGCARGAPAVSDQPPLPIPCIGWLDEGLLLQRAAARQDSGLLAGACSSCPSAAAQKDAEATVTRANALLQAFGRQQPIAVDSRVAPGLAAAPLPSTERPTVSRRDLFALIAGRRGSPDEAADTPGRGDMLFDRRDIRPGQALPVHLPATRQRLLDALRQLGQPPVGAGAAEAAHLWAQLAVTPACNGCMMCAFFCPTGALHKIEQGGKIGLAFRVAECTNCRLCQDVCLKRAVTLSAEIDLGKVVSGATDLYWPRRETSAPWFGAPWGAT